MAETAPKEASSPCIKLCTIDPGTGLCAGCGRTLEEIAAWSMMTDAERIALNAALPDRLARRRRPVACRLPTSPSRT
ncbi:MAG TPA: DUF1289 domain-containing protein [Beijerinckiaceae bacterium]|nr:DUF1289 domain-containing protein [Beijerinckiaceae bacterium]